MKVLHLLLAFLGLQLTTCARHFIASLNWQTYAARTIPSFAGETPRRIVALRGGVLVLLSNNEARHIGLLTGGEWHEVTRFSANNSLGETLVSGEDDRWWYAAASEHGVAVVNGQKDAAAPVQFISIPSVLPVEWHSLSGSRPRGAFVSFAKSGGLSVLETTPSGVLPLGMISASAFTAGAELRSMQPLPDGRVVVVAIDRRAVSSSRLTVQTLPAPEPALVAPQYFVDCAGFAVSGITSAINPGGKLAIVVRSGGPTNGTWVILTDPDRPETRCMKLTSSVGPAGTAAIVWAGDHFVAVWIGDDQLLHACDVDPTHATTRNVVLDHAMVMGDLNPSVQLHFVGSDHLAIAYNTSEGPRLHVLPNHVSGFAFADDLVKWISEIVHADENPRRH